jgi:hypothetical protein
MRRRQRRRWQHESQGQRRGAQDGGDPLTGLLLLLLLWPPPLLLLLLLPPPLRRRCRGPLRHCRHRPHCNAARRCRVHAELLHRACPALPRRPASSDLGALAADRKTRISVRNRSRGTKRHQK